MSSLIQWADTAASAQEDRHGPLPALLFLLTAVTGLVDAVSYPGVSEASADQAPRRGPSRSLGTRMMDGQPAGRTESRSLGHAKSHRPGDNSIEHQSRREVHACTICERYFR